MQDLFQYIEVDILWLTLVTIYNMIFSRRIKYREEVFLARSSYFRSCPREILILEAQEGTSDVRSYSH